jgi:hypothetical protein
LKNWFCVRYSVFPFRIFGCMLNGMCVLWKIWFVIYNMFPFVRFVPYYIEGMFCRDICPSDSKQDKDSETALKLANYRIKSLNVISKLLNFMTAILRHIDSASFGR